MSKAIMRTKRSHPNHKQIPCTSQRTQSSAMQNCGVTKTNLAGTIMYACRKNLVRFVPSFSYFPMPAVQTTMSFFLRLTLSTNATTKMKVVSLSSLRGSFLGRVVRSPSLVRHIKHHHHAIFDEIDDPATVMTTHVPLKESWKVQPSSKCHKAVHCDEQLNQVYENDLVLPSQDCLNLWYTSSELGQFRSKVRQDALLCVWKRNAQRMPTTTTLLGQNF